MLQTSHTRLAPGFADPVLESQSTFRHVLTALSRPGRICTLPSLPEAPKPMLPAAAALCLTLVDMDTPFWLETGHEDVAEYLRFHCGCPIIPQGDQAGFALVMDPSRLTGLNHFSMGTPEYPDKSTTLIVQVDDMRTGRSPTAKKLTGPGIKNEIYLQVDQLPQVFWSQFAENRILFPMGMDVLLVTADSAAALPRTVQVED